MAEPTPTWLDRIAARLRGDGSLRELGAGAGSAFAMRMGGKGLAYVFALVVAHLFGAAAWGRFSLAFVVVNLGAILALLGLDTVVVRFVAEARAAGSGAEVRRVLRRAFAVVVPWSLVVAAGAWALAPAVAEVVFSKPHLAEYLQRAALVIPPFAVLLLSAQALRGLKRVALSELMQQVLRSALPAAALVALATLGWSEAPVLDAFLAGTAVAAVVAVLVLVRSVGALDEGPTASAPDADHSVRALLTTGFPLLFAGSMVFLKGWIDTIMVGAFLDETAVGVYDIAFKLAALVIIPLGAVNSIAAPRIAELRRDRAGLQRFVGYATTAAAVSALPVFLVLFAAPHFVLGLFGPEYLAAATALRIIAAGMLVSALAGSVGVFLQMTGRQVAYQYISIAVVAVSAGLSWVLIPRFGINGAAVATSTALVTFNVVAVVYVWLTARIAVVWTPGLLRSVFAPSPEVSP